MNSFEKPYDANEKNWQKSVSELSKFFLDHLHDSFFSEKSNFVDKAEKDKVERLKERLVELLEKATKRLGYGVDEAKLTKEAYQHILDLKKSGELPPSDLLENFCAEIEERLEKSV